MYKMATFTVTSASDDGLGGLTLREAIDLANSTAAQDTINFSGALAGATIVLTGAELDITQDVTITGDINGDGFADITVNGAGGSRVFDVENFGGSPTEVVLDGLSISGGSAVTGGGLRTDVNTDVTITDSTFIGNQANFGGGIANFGSLTVINTTFENNSASNAGGAVATSGFTEIENSTVSGNTATTEGGGIYNSSGTTVVTNSTVSGNSAAFGGGISNDVGTVSLVNATVSGNTSTADGGGIYNSSGLRVANSIVAGNRNAGSIDDVSGPVVDPVTTHLGVNIFSQPGLASGPDITETDLLQIFDSIDGVTGGGFLGFNGGPTRTIALNPFGVAVDAGDNSRAVDPGFDALPAAGDSFLVNDQRGPGFVRIFDGDGNLTATVDIGAFEVQSAFPPPPPPVNPGLAPQITINTGIVLNEGNANVIDNFELRAVDPDNTPAEVAFTLTDLPDFGFIQRNGVTLGIGDKFSQANINNGDVRYLNNGGESTIDGFGFSVTDPDGSGPVFGSFNITINPINDVPQLAANTGISVPEAGIETFNEFNLLTSDPDNTPSELVYTVVTSVTNGTLTRNGVQLGNGDTFTQQNINDGLLVYTHDGSETTTDSFIISVTDPTGPALPNAQVDIGIFPVTTAPQIVFNTGDVLPEGGNILIDNTELRATDPDSPPGQVIFTVLNAPAYGQLRLAGVTLQEGSTFTQSDINSNLLRYLHDGGELTTDSFTFQVTDFDGTGTDIGLFTFGIDPVNDAPVLERNSGASAFEGGEVIIGSTNLLTSDADNTPNELVYTITNNVNHGFIRKNGAPLGNGDTFTQWDVDNNFITYDNDGEEFTSDFFQVTVEDPDGPAIGPFQVDLGIFEVNDVPVLDINIGLPGVAEDGSALITAANLTATDDDNPPDEIIYTLTDLPDEGTLLKNLIPLAIGNTFTQEDINNGLLSYEAIDGEFSPDNFSFVLSNPDGTSGSLSTFLIGITTANDAPALTTNLILNPDEESSVPLLPSHVEATDPDNLPEEIRFTLTSLPSVGTILRDNIPLMVGQGFTQADINLGLVEYLHDGTETFNDTFEVDIRDPDGAGPSGETIFVFINSINDGATVVTNVPEVVDEGGTVTIDTAELNTFDPDNLIPAEVIFTLTTGPVDGTLFLDALELSAGDQFTQADIDAGLVSYTHNGAENPTDSFNFALSNPDDTAGESDTFVIAINPINDVPELIDQGLTPPEGTLVPITPFDLDIFDPDNTPDEIVYTLQSLPGHASIHLNGIPLEVGDTWTQADIDQGRLFYCHNGSEYFTDSFIVDITDGAGGMLPGQVIDVNVTPINDGLILEWNRGIRVTEGGSKAVFQSELRFSDAESRDGEITYTVDGLPENGTLFRSNSALKLGDMFTQDDIDNRSIRYEHNGTDTNSDKITLDVTDGDGDLFDDLHLVVTVVPANDPPVLGLNTGISLSDGGSEIIDASELQGLDGDNAAGEIRFVLTETPINGFLALNGAALSEGGSFTQADINAGAVTYNHTVLGTTSDSFTFNLRDPDVIGPVGQVLSISIGSGGNGNGNGGGGGNNAPDARDDAFSTGKDSSFAGNVFTNNGSGADFDPDGDSFSVSAVQGAGSGIGQQITLPSGALLTLNANGSFSYNPNGQFSSLGDGQTATDTFTYAISDSGGASDSATVTVTLNGGGAGPATVLNIAAAVSSVAEGNTVSVPQTFVVTRTGATDTAVSASYTVSGGGTFPAAASDFIGNVLPSGTVSLAAGQVSATISVPVRGDFTPEENETFTVTLENATVSSGTVTIETDTAEGTIVNDDQAVTQQGSDAKDKSKGTDDADVVDGLGGKDKIKGRDGNDTLFGGDGDDTLKGEDGDDNLFGEEGDDKLDGGDGDDLLDGGPGNDKLDGKDGDDMLFGGDGADDLDGGKDNDSLDGGSGNDELDGDKGDDTLYGGLGTDELKGGKDADTFVFDEFSDTDIITDFDVDEDLLDLSAFGVTTLDAFLSLATQDNKDVRFQPDGANDLLVIEKVDLDEFSADNFTF